MPICPKHGEALERVYQGIEYRGEGWNRYQIYFEDYLCTRCKFRIRQYFKVINIGGG